ncbi:uncharacterized protein LOC132608109 [Lycium barbarum]|uniref:uncharacterized protein LOC132608109 n=1 Tax=Lycium barbarum TaxID=112863 RepID=UPI00293EED4C|nr:uncharacterized protein LOC132608109 [Lycium barbarum]
MAEKQFSKNIKIFQRDGSGEFSSSEFVKYLENCGIVRHISCPHIPKQNGLAERKYRHFLSESQAEPSSSHHISPGEVLEDDLVTDNATKNGIIDPSLPTADGSPSIAPCNTTQDELASDTQNHHMVTRLKAKSLPITHTSLAVIKTDVAEPKSIKEALSSPHWLTTMQEELTALHRNET